MEKLTDFYVQEIINNSQRYLERDEQLLRKLVRQLLDQYATKREIASRLIDNKPTEPPSSEDVRGTRLTHG